jgi:hypothetical protein
VHELMDGSLVAVKGEDHRRVAPEEVDEDVSSVPWGWVSG